MTTDRHTSQDDYITDGVGTAYSVLPWIYLGIHAALVIGVIINYCL